MLRALLIVIPRTPSHALALSWSLLPSVSKRVYVSLSLSLSLLDLTLRMNESEPVKIIQAMMMTHSLTLSWSLLPRVSRECVYLHLYLYLYLYPHFYTILPSV